MSWLQSPGYTFRVSSHCQRVWPHWFWQFDVSVLASCHDGATNTDWSVYMWWRISTKSAGARHQDSRAVFDFIWSLSKDFGCTRCCQGSKQCQWWSDEGVELFGDKPLCGVSSCQWAPFILNTITTPIVEYNNYTHSSNTQYPFEIKKYRIEEASVEETCVGNKEVCLQTHRVEAKKHSFRQICQTFQILIFLRSSRWEMPTNNYLYLNLFQDVRMITFSRLTTYNYDSSVKNFEWPLTFFR